MSWRWDYVMCGWDTWLNNSCKQLVADAGVCFILGSMYQAMHFTSRGLDLSKVLSLVDAGNLMWFLYLYNNAS